MREGGSDIMKATPGPVLSGLLAAAVLLAAGRAQADSAACELLKQTLAERIEQGGVRGYSLEAVPARAPVPSGAKGIGTCDGGATRIVYWRFGAPGASAHASRAAQPASVASADAPAAMRVPPAGASTVAKAAVAQAVVAQAVVAQAVVPQAVVPQAAVPQAAVTQPAPTQASPPRHVETAAAPTRSAASEVTLATIADRSAAMSPAPSGEPAAAVRAAAPGPAPAPAARLAGHWPWLAGALALPLAVALWAWITRRRAYDSAGLPRGPRL
jgi:hypothetical protein